MPSQISQVAPGHMLNSVAPATGGKSDRRDADTARQEGSFQSVMGETPAANAEKPDAERSVQSVASAVTDDAGHDAELATETSDIVLDDEEFLAEQSDSTPDTIQGQPAAEFELDDAEVEARPRPETAAGEGNEGDTETPDPLSAEPNSTKSHANGIPAWLVTSLAAEKPLQNEKPSGSSGLEEAIASVAKETAAPVIEGHSRHEPNPQAHNMLTALAKETQGITRSDSTETEMRAQSSEDTPRLKEVTPFIRNPARNAPQNAPITAVPGAEIATAQVPAAMGAGSNTEKEGRAHPRSEEPLAGFRSTRSAEPTTPPNAKVPASPQMPPQPNAPLKAQSKDISDVRWVSDVSFTADAPALEAPATSRLQQAALLQQPDLPRNIAVQLAQALRQGGGERPMELVLNPAELGRVRISMQASDGAMTVQVLADRPETLDLMRRNIDTLAQEFHDMGFGSADFAFGQSMAGGDSADSEGTNTDRDKTIHLVDDIDAAETVAAPSSLAIHSDRVDIRL